MSDKVRKSKPLAEISEVDGWRYITKNSLRPTTLFKRDYDSYGLQLYLKETTTSVCFPVDFVRYVRTPLLQKTPDKYL